MNAKNVTMRGAMMCAATLGTMNTMASSARGDHSVEIRVVAVTGTHAPGTPTDVNFWLFTTGLNHSIMHPVIDEQGELAFTGRVIGPGVDASNRNGLWAERNGATTLIVRSGTPAPGTPEGINFNGFSTDYIPTPPLAAGGRLAFQAEVVGPGVTFGNASGIWREEIAGAVALVARQGDPAPGLGAGATFSADLYLAAFNATGHVLLSGKAFGPAITSDNDEMLWSDRSGTLMPVLREGIPAPGLNGLTIGVGQLGSSQFAIPRAVFNGASEFFVQANLRGAGVTAFNDEALWIENSGQLTLLVREGQSVPGAGQGATFGGQGVTIGVYSMAFNDLGHAAFTSDLDTNNSSSTTLFSTHTGVLAPVALPGQPAPGMEYDFSYVGNPMLNNAGKIVFAAWSPDDDTDPFTHPPLAIWSDRTGSLVPVVHPGDAVLGREGATVTGTSFIVGFNSAGEVAFRAAIEDPKIPYADALFLSDNEGVNHLVVATSDAFDVFGDGRELRTVTRIVHGGLSENGQLAFRVDFSDESSGHYVAQVGSIEPCSADVNGSGGVNIDDLLMVINNWGAGAGNAADITGNDVVNIDDLLAVINAWGACP
jgi:hypothetical protein